MITEKEIIDVCEKNNINIMEYVSHKLFILIEKGITNLNQNELDYYYTLVRCLPPNKIEFVDVIPPRKIIIGCDKN